MFYNGNGWHNICNNTTTSKLNIGESSQIAISGDGNTIVVGLPNTTEQSLLEAGSVMIYKKTNNRWDNGTKLIAPTGFHLDSEKRFGHSVNISDDGTRLVVGLNIRNTGDVNKELGAGFIYDFDGNSWGTPTIFQLPTPAYADRFGHSVAISGNGNRVVFGSTSTAITNGDGQIWVYEFDGTNWDNGTQLLGPNVIHTGLGQEVEISNDGNTIATSSRRDGSFSYGAVYVYKHNGSAWGSYTKLTQASSPTPHPDSQLGFFRLSLNDNGTKLLVSNLLRKVPNGAGGALIFSFNSINNSWNTTGTLLSDPSGATDYFGSDVQLSESGEKALIGTFDGTKAYLFKNENGNWIEESTINSPINSASIFGKALDMNLNAGLFVYRADSSIFIIDKNY